MVLVEDLEKKIERRAYELFEARGSEPGHELEDWLEAEREVRAAMPATAESGPP